jgi:NADH-quinone oxidoreductase subunit L
VIDADTLFWIPALPFLGFALIVLLGLLKVRTPKPLVSLVCCGVVAAAFVVAVLSFRHVGEEPLHTRAITWISVPGIDGGTKFEVELPWQLMMDRLSGIMTLVVTGVGFLIHLYSVGYMGHDPRYGRYMAYLNLFTGFMLTLVLAQNLIAMFVGWEGVGLCSYLLIGFWYDKTGTAEAGTGNALAGNKAFIVNRIGDWGFTVGVLLLFVMLGKVTTTWTLDLPTLKALMAKPGVFEAASVAFTAAAILMFVGATGKSAQIPLYVWLPDAMAGPTPVSALIHAATMVTAGVYMVCRMGFLFERAPVAMGVVAVIGALTALVAATIGLCQTDIKKVLAYSTVSQLGFMFIAAGVGAFAVAIFHVVTHAFFKACLFLGSGSVIHGCGGEQDIRKMGGLRKYMPITAITFFVACVAIAGVPGLSGFFSKDAILGSAFNTSAFGWIWLGPAVGAIGIFAAVLTAFYMFRLYFLTFEGEYRGPEPVPSGHGSGRGPEPAGHGSGHGPEPAPSGHGSGHGTPHESPWTMTAPLVVLAILSVVGGYLGVLHFLEEANLARQSPAHENHLIMAASICAAFAGILGAWWMYRRRTELPARAAAQYPRLYAFVRDKYRVDEAYWATLIDPLLIADERLGQFDNNVIDGAVNGSASATAATSHQTGRFDNGVVDGAVNGAADGVQAAGRSLRRLQTGNIKAYIATAVVGGLFVIVFYAALSHGGAILHWFRGS